ncbi:hypothetical protein H632_c405p1 [Helicosporidium sp. ATCC 50920]|nr:hypothetical protein H632_c405p1 [Helicosporidium sp. ATCC 50920]|eukprot:KDD75991.1 hypothetical protein H632_c405p1 [Helicosporidium sp. ATCC 50920]
MRDVSARPPAELAEQVPQDSESCFARYPWIEPTLEHFFANARESSRKSTLTVEQSFDFVHAIRWNQYQPGHDVVTLATNASTGALGFSSHMVKRSNLLHKSPFMLRTLEEAVQAHGPALAKLLAGREMRLILQTEDTPIVGLDRNLKVPPFSACASRHDIDVPVPDFTYKYYPETRHKDTSWPAVGALLAHKSEMLLWSDRSLDIFQRNNWNVGHRKKLLPLLDGLTQQGHAVEVLGAPLDINDTRTQVHRSPAYKPIDSWCEHKFQLHTGGLSYSTSLKYRLACASVVFLVPFDFEEFFEKAVREAGVVVTLPPFLRGDNHMQRWLDEAAPIIKDTVMRYKDAPDVPDVAVRGREWVLHNLQKDALDCYWYGTLKRYAELYFS